MTFSTRRHLCLGATVWLLGGCGNSDDSSAPQSKTDGGTAAGSGGGQGGSGGAFASTNVAYVTASDTQGDTTLVFVYDFASQSFVTQPLLEVAPADGQAGLALSGDGHTLYVDHQAAPGMAADQVDAYALTSTGATLLASVPCAPWESNVVVPQPTGRVQVYAGEPIDSVVEEDGALGTVVTPSTPFSFYAYRIESARGA